MFGKKEHIPKAHVFRDGVKELKQENLKQINKSIIMKAKENKVYRKGTVDGHVIVGVDGVETFGSYKKDWNGSYKTKIKVQEYWKFYERWICFQILLLIFSIDCKQI